MVRCEDFYKKFKREGNFCDKHPDTASRIEKYMHLMPEIEEAASKSEILKDDSEPIVRILSEGASRPLVSVKNPEIQKKVIQRIVKKAEEKKMDDERILLTYKEVAEIVREFMPSTKKATKAPKDKLEKVETQLKDVLNDVANTPEAVDLALAKIEKISSLLQTTKQSLTQRKEALSHENAVASPDIHPNSQNQPDVASAGSGT